MEEKAYYRNRAYEYFGCHRQSAEAGKYRYVFRLMQNTARSVELCADFLSKSLPLSKNEIDVWELVFESNIPIEGMSYRYKVFSEHEEKYIRDPFSFHLDEGDVGGTIIEELERCVIASIPKSDVNRINAPLNICRINFDNFERLNYRDLTEKCLSDIKALNFTHVEIANINDCACFAPSPQYGTPSDFKYFVDMLKHSGIGVLLQLCLDFKVDDELYASFIRSAVLYWFRYFGIDGIRVDLNELKGSSEKLLKDITRSIKEEFPDSLMIADGNSLYGKVTSKESDGGLGFDFVLDRGWSRDMLEYVTLDPISRNGDNKMLTFSFSYACAEQFILPITESEVERIFLSALENGKKLKDIFVLVGMMITHPGKKMLSFELASVEKLRRFISDINMLYWNNKELFELDASENGFKLIDSFSGNGGVIAFKRFSKARSELLCVMNFSDSEHTEHKIENVGCGVESEEIFNSTYYSQSRRATQQIRKTVCSSDAGTIELDIPPHSIIIFKLRKNFEKKKDKG